MYKRQQQQSLIKICYGFSLLELMVGLSILGILVAVGVPALSEFTVKSRVDNEISELRRLVLTARNNAINSGQFITLCPLKESTCQTSNWQNELSVFTNTVNDLANAKSYDSSKELIIKVKAAASSGDKVQSTQDQIVFSPTGMLASPGPVTLRYCPEGRSDLSRAVVISLSGGSYSTTDTNGDGKDEDRNGNNITCT